MYVCTGVPSAYGCDYSAGYIVLKKHTAGGVAPTVRAANLSAGRKRPSLSRTEDNVAIRKGRKRNQRDVEGEQDSVGTSSRLQSANSSLPLSPPPSTRFREAQLAGECSPSADGQAQAGRPSSASRESRVEDLRPQSRFQEDLRRIWNQSQKIPGSIEPWRDRKEYTNEDEYVAEDESTCSDVCARNDKDVDDEDVSSHGDSVNDINATNDNPANNAGAPSSRPRKKAKVDAESIEELVNLSRNNKPFIRKVVTYPTLQCADNLVAMAMLVIMLESVDQLTDASRQEIFYPIKQMNHNSSASLMYIARQHKSRAPVIDAIWKLYLGICAIKLYDTYPLEFEYVQDAMHRRLAFEMTIAADIAVLKEEGYDVQDLEKEYMGPNTRKKSNVIRGAHKILDLFKELGPQILFTLGGELDGRLFPGRVSWCTKKGLTVLVTYDK